MIAALAFIKPVWAFLTSKVGIGVMIVLGVLLAIFLFGQARYNAGVKAGSAKVQATIDAPLTGWSARLAQCTANSAVKDQAIQSQNDAIAAATAASSAALAKASTDLKAAQAQTATYQSKIATLSKPLTATDSCARVNEAFQRLQETLQ